MNEQQLTNFLLKWWYNVDQYLDDSDLASFHDKSMVEEKAREAAIQILDIHYTDGTKCWCNPQVVHVSGNRLLDKRCRKK